MKRQHLLAIAAALASAAPIYNQTTSSFKTTVAANNACSAPLVGYWGQNSAGIVNPDRSKWEGPLIDYCDGTYDIINLSFLNIFPSDTRNPSSFKPPTLNFAYHCEQTFDGYPFLLNCPDIGRDIQQCQQRGIKIVLSIGGATGPYGFVSDAEARNFATTFWNMFLGGSAAGIPRPFGTGIILDGVDLDIEAGSNVGYPAFIGALRDLYQTGSKRYLITAAPQCPFPDAYLSTALSSSWFDVINVQFYNNYCQVSNTANFNFNDWASWARSTSQNKDVKIMVGVPSAPAAAGSGYIDINRLKEVTSQLVSTNNFGGVMLWEVSLAKLNVGASGKSFATEIKEHLNQICGGNPNPIPVPTSSSSSVIRPTPNLPVPQPPPVQTTLVRPPVETTAVPVETTAVPVEPTPIFSVTPVPPEPEPTNPSPAPGDPVDGAACNSATDGAGTCSGTQYAQCIYDQWLLRDCAPGTVCKKVSGGGFICDWP